MNTLVLAPLSAATLLVSTAPANAAAPFSPAGHWEWQRTGQYGPRAALPTSHHVWIADPKAIAVRDCGTMSKVLSSADCMAMMDAKSGPTATS